MEQNLIFFMLSHKRHNYSCWLPSSVKNAMVNSNYRRNVPEEKLILWQLDISGQDNFTFRV